LRTERKEADLPLDGFLDRLRGGRDSGPILNAKSIDKRGRMVTEGLVEYRVD
jgi:hypothetical protein